MYILETKMQSKNWKYANHFIFYYEFYISC